MIVDKLGRRFRNLRVSLTAACNYACTYCVPDGKRLQPARNELPATALLKGVKLLQQAAGIDKLRITGGEPLVTPKFDEFLLGVMALPLADVSLTTNGQLLGRKREVIRESGIKRINVSLDTPQSDAVPTDSQRRRSWYCAGGHRWFAGGRHQGEDQHGAIAHPEPQ